MRLYHFTARHSLEPILRQGITKGLTPYQHEGTIAYLAGTQWLTLSPSYHQYWNEGINRNQFDRTAWRAQVRIPRKKRTLLLGFDAWRTVLDGSMIASFDIHGDPENWFIYRGAIPREWIIGIEPKPTAASISPRAQSPGAAPCESARRMPSPVLYLPHGQETHHSSGRRREVRRQRPSGIVDPGNQTTR